MGMVQLAKTAIGASGKVIPFETVRLGIRGDMLVPAE
jgi:hypothetical protein